MGSKYQDIRFKWLAEKGFNVLSDQHQYAYVQSLWSPIDLVQGVFCDSPAGTGKTVLAVLSGAYEVEKGTYKKIIYIRNTEIVGREIGFLTGDFDNKVGVHMTPFIEALDYVRANTYEYWLEQGLVQATSTTHLRGVTFDNSFVIIDEAQNLSLEELQTIYTRVTDTCKIITIGSLRQVDAEKLKRYNGKTPFEIYMEHFKGKPATFHKLVRNYRGEWSRHADNIQKTIKGEDIDGNEDILLDEESSIIGYDNDSNLKSNVFIRRTNY